MNGLPKMVRHDRGCRCWPHVSEVHVSDAIVEAARIEYREGNARLARVLAELRAAVAGLTEHPHYIPAEDFEDGWREVRGRILDLIDAKAKETP